MNKIKIHKENMDKGFSIIEVIIAMVIFAIGILAIGVLHIVSIQGNSTARRMSEASILATDQMERLISLPFPGTTISGVTVPNNDISATLQFSSCTAVTRLGNAYQRIIGSNTSQIKASTQNAYTITWDVTDNPPTAVDCLSCCTTTCAAVCATFCPTGCATSPGIQTKTVNMTVTWSDQGTNRTITMSHIIALMNN